MTCPWFLDSLHKTPDYVLRKYCWLEAVLKVQHCWTTWICTVVCDSQIMQNCQHLPLRLHVWLLLGTYEKMFSNFQRAQPAWNPVEDPDKFLCFTLVTCKLDILFHHFSHWKRHVAATCILYAHSEGACLSFTAQQQIPQYVPTSK